MLADALAQFLRFKKWTEILVLRGPAPEDAAETAAFTRAARRFGLTITAERPFILSNDPRRREQDNVALLTGGASYDVVYVADAEGTFARELPYATARPRPVVGAAGLAAHAWHSTWERHGGPQVSHRFERAAKRRMEGADWAAWIAVRAVAEAIGRTGGAGPGEVDKLLLGGSLAIDGAKGRPVGFRPWDRQLRQPILLATGDAVVATAPLPGFLHATEVLDTLGADRPETQCRF
jgi:ABC transporter substrate binding protein (PQQ-dependent alcohol dehydrogenase system)